MPTSRTKSPLQNTPPLVSGRPHGVWVSALVNGEVKNARMFVIALLAILVAVAMGVSLWRLQPTERTVPVHVAVDAATGRVEGRALTALQGADLAELAAAEARNYVRALLELDPHQTQRMLNGASSRSAGKASTQLRELIASERPFERLNKTPGLVRAVEVNSVDSSQKGIAFVFATTAERVAAGQAISQKWRVTLHYVLDQSMRKSGTDAFTENPLGFYVTHFDLAREKS